MTKYPKAVKDSNYSQTMECPHCGKVTGTFTDSTFTNKGYRRLRYKNYYLFRVWRKIQNELDKRNLGSIFRKQVN